MLDLILFAGQSNMAGRGDASQAPVPGPDMGWEYRPITAPGQLMPIREPVGRDENRTGGIDDGDKKSGGLVSAFVCEYHKRTGRQVVAVSASQGGTTSRQWTQILARDAAGRLKAARACLHAKGLAPDHVFVLWCQGESDGDQGIDAQRYTANFDAVWSTLRAAGAEHCFVISIGHFNLLRYPRGLYGLSGEQLDDRYSVIRSAQYELCRAREDVSLAADFEPCLPLMKDEFHYYQAAYNAAGAKAAVSMADYIEQNG